jgi:hypothetical protein
MTVNSQGIGWLVPVGISVAVALRSSDSTLSFAPGATTREAKNNLSRPGWEFCEQLLKGLSIG